MLKSMTGYGQAHGKVAGRSFQIEVKSVNYKYCEVNVRLPNAYLMWERAVVELAKSYVSRGRVDVFIREETAAKAPLNLKVDRPRLKVLYQELHQAAKACKVPSDLTLKDLLSFSQAFVVEKDIPEDFWEGLAKLLHQALNALNRMRSLEGKTTAIFLKEQLNLLTQEVQWIQARVPEVLKEYHKQLEQRIAKLTQEVAFDPQRVAQEVAFFVDRTDISEELDRLASHGKHFRQLLGVAGPLGRKLDFLLQEMNREVNTLSAKIQNAAVSQRVVECKHILERMREQVQNLE